MPIVYVDYPAEISLKQIYGTFNRAMLRLIPALRSYAEPLTNAMVDFYLESQDRFTQVKLFFYVGILLYFLYLNDVAKSWKIQRNGNIFSYFHTLFIVKMCICW